MNNSIKNILLVIILLFINFIISSCSQQADNSSSASLISGYQKGELINSEDFSSNLSNWLTEGKIIAKIVNGKLLVESYDLEIDNPKGNIWWKEEFSTPFVLEFEFQSLSNEGLAMVFWNANGINGNDIFSWERTGKYEEYVNSNLRAYHLSFHRFGSGISNIRKAPGFHLVSSAKDPIGVNDRKKHLIQIVSAEERQKIYFDHKLVHDFIDKSEPCINKQDWQHVLPCKGTGEIPTHGAIGVRHTQNQKAYYDNFKVYNLNKS